MVESLDPVASWSYGRTHGVRDQRQLFAAFLSCKIHKRVANCHDPQIETDWRHDDVQIHTGQFKLVPVPQADGSVVCSGVDPDHIAHLLEKASGLERARDALQTNRAGNNNTDCSAADDF